MEITKALQNLFPIVAWNSFFSVFGKLSVKVISFLFTILIIRWLGDKGYGQYSLIWSYVIVFSMLSDAGLGMYAIREIAKGRPNSQYIVGNIIVMRVFLALATIGLIMLTVWLLGYGEQFLFHSFLAGTVLLLYAVQDPLDALLQARERFGPAATATVVGQLVFVATGAFFLWAGWHITGLIIAGLLNVFVSAGLVWRFTANQQGGIQWRIRPAWWPGFVRNSISFGLIKLWLSWSLKIDLIILAWFWMEEMVGWYSAAYAIILGITVISNAINAALYPNLSRIYAQTPSHLPKACGLILKCLLVISLPIAGIVFVTADKVVDLLYGPEFNPTMVGLAILIWVVPLTFVSEFLRYVLLAANQERAAVKGLGLAVLLNVSFNLWLIPLYGFLGAAIVAIITEAFLIVLYSWQLKSELKSIHLADVFLKPLLATGALMVVVRITPLSNLLLQIALGAIIFVTVIWILGVVKMDEYRQSFQLFKPCEMSLPSSVNAQPESAPLISIFILTYNAEYFLPQAIESVLGQTYQNFELIVLNDGSTDNTADILEKYEAHPKVTILHNEKNLGISPSWNIALGYCRGEIIAKLDADDFYEPHQLETVIEFYQSHREVGLIFSGLNLIFPDGHSEPEMRYLRSWVRNREEFLPHLLRLCLIRAPTVFVSRTCYKQLGGVIEDMKLHSDWEMWVRVAANYPVGFIARRLANYRVSYGPNATAQAAIDGRSMHDLRLWLELLDTNKLPYQLTSPEKAIFQSGIYDLEMHFAAMAAYYNQEAMQHAYIAFAEEILPHNLSPPQLIQMRRVHTNLHQGICAFRDHKFQEARRHFLQAIKAGPSYCKPLWIWNKLLLTFIGRTKWGILHK